MTYRQTLDYLFGQLPMYQRIGPAAYKGSLDNTLALSRHLGYPERDFPAIHVAGTNGKGSVAHMLASILQEEGYKTGLATSPHFTDFRERLKINGRLVPEAEVVRFVAKHKPFFEKTAPSFFEMAMALTFSWFSRQQVDVAVVETGMGGRLDSSNIVRPLVSVITNIGYDHVAFLGPRLADIAREKAGIIKEGVPVVVGRKQPEVHGVFQRKASRKGAPLVVASDMFDVVNAVVRHTENNRSLLAVELSSKEGRRTWQLGVTGSYQQENLCTALAAVDVLNKGNAVIKVGEQAIAEGLLNVVENTGMAGRWQEIGRDPLIICDAGHNADGIGRVTAQLADTPHRRLLMVFGMVDDKERNGILQLLPRNATYYFCKPNVPRGLDAKVLCQDASDAGLKGRPFTTVREALTAAKLDAAAEDLIFVGGSTFVVAEVV